MNFTYTFGARALTSGQTEFSLWAPNATRVAVKAGEERRDMARDADGFFKIQTDLPVGTRYRYEIDGAQLVPDPASRLQAEGVHGDSVVTAADDYPWQQTAWAGRPWHETVLYEIHAGVAGGYAGIENRLAELKALGVTAIELMPIADFPGNRNWGYDGVLPYAPHASYGSPAELKHLIDAAHGLDMMVFLDVVYNHFGPDGNYLNAYAADFFDASKQTPWGPAIDFSQAPVRRFFAENALYWLKEFRFDGLRFDAVHAIIDQSWLPEMAAFVRSQLPAERHVHLVLENEDNNASHLENGFDAQWNDDAHHVLHHLLTDETRAYYADFSDAASEKLARVLSSGFVYQNDPSPLKGGEMRGQPSGHLPPTAFVLFLQNHDQIGNRAFGERLTELTRDKPDALRCAIALQLLTPHIPLLFMGEERGVTTPFLYFTSHEDEKLVQAIRDGRKREFAGFNDHADPETIARLPDPNDIQTFESSKDVIDVADPHAAEFLSYYRQLLDLRRDRVTPGLPGAEALGAQSLNPHSVVARWRLGNQKVLTLYVNLGESAVESDSLADDYDPLAEVIFENRPGADAALRAATLQGYSMVALLRHD